jgi:hypothetical protein
LFTVAGAAEPVRVAEAADSWEEDPDGFRWQPGQPSAC